MLGTVLHFLVGLLGLALLYSALFLHENEQGELQNRLEKLWIDIDDLSESALSMQAAFLQRVSAMANSALNRLFGKRLLSVGAVASSLCFSLGTALLLLLAIGGYLGYMISPSHAFFAFVIGTVSFLVGLLPIPFRYIGLPWVLSVVFLVLHFDWELPRPEGWTLWSFLKRESLPFFHVLVGGFLSDILFIALSRWCLRKCSEFRNGWKIAALLTVNGCVGLAFISPLILQIISNVKGHFAKDHTIVVFRPFLLLGVSNGVAGAMALLFVVLSLAALAHLVVWPLLERPLYSLQRFGVARNPKLLVSASVSCLLFAWPHSPLILGITKVLHLG